MFLFLKYFFRGSKRHLLQSNGILAGFVKAKNELTTLNTNIQMDIEVNEKKAIAIAKENEALLKMRQNHDKVISNIDNFLNV